MKLNIIEGIGDSYEQKLKEAGIKSSEQLLESCSSKKGRTKLAEKTGITEKLILKWTNHADLFRIKEVGGEYAELLEAAGVDTVPEKDPHSKTGWILDRTGRQTPADNAVLI